MGKENSTGSANDAASLDTKALEEKQTAESLGDTQALEEKRAAARRRFLSGVPAGAVLTFLHRRANASVILVSSTATCNSLRGTPGTTVQAVDSITHLRVTKVQCIR